MDNQTLDKISKLHKIPVCYPLPLDSSNQVVIVLDNTPVITIKIQDLYI